MMKKNGFTLIELLAVIVVIAVIMVIVTPSLLNTGDSARDKLTEVEKKNLIDAGKMLALDLNDSESDIYNCSGWITECSKSNGKWISVTMSVSDLISHGYFTDNYNHLGDYQVTVDSNYNVTVSK